MIRFSLIVCTLGRRDEIAELFASILLQDRDDFELILIDQNRDDRLVEIVSRYSDRLPIKHLRMTATGLSRGRNLGLDHACGELIGFPDDDCKYLEGYLQAVDQLFTQDRSIGSIAGHPTAIYEPLNAGWAVGRVDLTPVTLLNRCQEFTVFVRRENLGSIRYNELMGVGAQTPWGADEGPEFLIRLLETGCRLVFFPRLFVYHPNKIATITRSTLGRAASYARGRGCLFRLHKFPKTMVFNGLFRPAVGCILYLLRLQPMRASYYFTIFRNTLRGLLMSQAELAEVRANTRPVAMELQPIGLPALPEQPLVSVLIANYNYARYLPAALDSLLAQTYKNWHAVVCDDGSTDDSVNITNGYIAKDSRIQLVQKSNGGQTSTVNACYSHMKGDIICLLDADDVFEPRKIQAVVDAFIANPRAGMCNHFANIIDGQGQIQPVTLNHKLDSGWLANNALDHGACIYVPTTSSMSLRKEIADLMFPIPDKQSRDVDGYIGMIAQFLAEVAVVHEPLAGYRVHGNNMGGITEPTPDRLKYELFLIELRTENVKQFVSDRFGAATAARILLEDNPQYVQAALKMLAIEKSDGRWSRAMALIRRHPNPKWRAIWRAIFSAPGPLSRRAVPMMHRSHRAKAVVHRLMGRSKAVTA